MSSSGYINVTCKKCQGSGKFITYSGRVGGICFTCQGTGEIRKEEAKQAETRYCFPSLVRLVLEKGIKLYLANAKVVMAQSGVLYLTAHEYGDGTFGKFDKETGEFFPNKRCKPEMLAELKEVDERGIEAVKEIGRLTGCCCICGRMLTDETSIAEGIGPICSGRMIGKIGDDADYGEI